MRRRMQRRCESGATATAPERTRPHRQPCAASARRQPRRTTPRARAAATKELRPGATPPRARRHGRAGDEERQHDVAGSGAARLARRRLSQGRTRPHRQPCAESTRRRPRHTTPRARAAVAKERRPSVTPPRARRRGRAGDEERQHGAPGSGAARAARRRSLPERMRPRRQPRAESARCRLCRTTPRARAAVAKERRPSVTPPRARWSG